MPARSCVAPLLLACMSVRMAAEPAPPNERLDRFRAALRRPLAALVEAAGKHADAQNGLLGRLRDPELKQINRAYASARAAFRAAVVANWPYPLERPALPAAVKALAAARAFEQDLYRNGRATAEEAAQRYLAVANEFPNSRERRAALRAAYQLCTPHSPAARRIARRLDQGDAAQGPGPPQGPKEVRGRLTRKVTRATAALEAATDFDEQVYRKGNASRAQTVARYVAVADGFPRTIEHDKALFRAAYVYLRRLAGGATMDLPRA